MLDKWSGMKKGTGKVKCAKYLFALQELAETAMKALELELRYLEVLRSQKRGQGPGKEPQGESQPSMRHSRVSPRGVSSCFLSFSKEFLSAYVAWKKNAHSSPRLKRLPNYPAISVSEVLIYASRPLQGELRHHFYFKYIGLGGRYLLRDRRLW